MTSEGSPHPKNFLYSVKGLVLFISLFYLTFYVPMSLTFYSSAWMKLNCRWHDRCEMIGVDNAYRGMDELAAYFRHQGELDSFRTKKEKLHLEEVRGMFDKMFVAAIAAAVLLALTFDRRRASLYALINIAIILSLLFVLPFFGTFWKDVFHPLLFKNNLWMNNRFDLSFYLMPRDFFKYTVALLIFSTAALNAFVWLRWRPRRAKPGH